MNLLSHWPPSNGLMPHGFCYQWNPALMWLHAVSDTLIALAYFSIPFALLHFVRKRRDIPFSWMFVCFGVFIAASGATHLMEVWTLWVPSYWFSGGVKVVTALASIPTAASLVRLVPQALSFPSSEAMKAANEQMEAVLRESEDRYRDLVEHSNDLICTYNLEGQLLSVNELPAKLLGYSPEELLKKPMRDFLLPEARAQFDASLVSIQREGFVKGAMVVLTKSGERRIWEYHNTLRTNGVTTPIVRGIAHDVTDQKRMERALRLSEEKFSKAFLASPHAIVISTVEDDKVLEVNDGFQRIMGFSREESIGRTSFELGLWSCLADRNDILSEFQRTGRVQSKQVTFRTKSGKNLEVNYSAELIEVGRRKCLLSVCDDITERLQAEEELRRLSGQLLRSQDEERRSIARDLHDSTGQNLVVLATSLAQLHASIPATNRKSRKLVSESQTLADQCIREVRTLSYLLHPPLLEEAGLEDAIRLYAEGFTKRSGILVELEISSQFGRLDRDTELTLFRVIQESLTNIQRHSGSLQAKIRIDRSPRKIAMEISDAGGGLSGNRPDGISRLGLGVGIASMHERVKLIGGRFDIESGSRGTIVRVTVPVNG